jgi:hypothetical protein
MSLFEKASRLKLRFPTIKGPLTAEQLWDLPLTSANGPSLDGVAKAANANLKAVTEESFVATTSNPEKTQYELQLEIAKHIIAVKQEESANRLATAAKAEQRERLRQIIRDKQDQSLNNLSEEELTKRLDALA